MMLYKFLDLPKIPDDLIKTVGNNFEYVGYKLIPADPKLEQWARENITDEYDEFGIRYAYGSDDVTTPGVHTDLVRDWILIYNVDNGGGNINFWQEKGFPLLREGGQFVDDYDRLTLIESVPTPNHQWYLINGKVLHSVENLRSTRTNVQFSLSYNLYERLSAAQGQQV